MTRLGSYGEPEQPETAGGAGNEERHEEDTEMTEKTEQQSSGVVYPLPGSAAPPDSNKVRRSEVRSILGDLKSLFEAVEVGDEETLREIRDKSGQALQLVAELQELLETTGARLDDLRVLLEQITETANDNGES